MNHSKVKTPYAKLSPSTIGSAEDLIHASKAEPRKDYFCPDCSGIVRRRLSHKGTYHFFHKESECSGGGLETVLHLLAKSVIEQEKKIWIPDCNAQMTIALPAFNEDGSIEYLHKDSERTINLQKTLRRFKPDLELFSIFYSKEEEIDQNSGSLLHTFSIHKPFGFREIQSVRVEESINNIRPDLIVDIDGISYLVEVANTHFIDPVKKEKIKKLNIPTIEINVSDIEDISFSSIRDLILNKNDKTSWIHYSNQLEYDFEEQAHFFNKSYVDKKKKEIEKERIRLANAQALRDQNRSLVQQNRLLNEQLKTKADNLNQSDMKLGLPELYGTPKQILSALDARNIRIRCFGRNDMLVQEVVEAGDWVECKVKNQLRYQHPFSMDKYFRMIEERKKKKEIEEKKQGMILDSYKTLIPEPKSNIEEERAKGEVIYCPKCRSYSYEFKEQGANLFARICYKCKHSERL